MGEDLQGIIAKSFRRIDRTAKSLSNRQVTTQEHAVLPFNKRLHDISA